MFQNVFMHGQTFANAGKCRQRFFHLWKKSELKFRPWKWTKRVDFNTDVDESRYIHCRMHVDVCLQRNIWKRRFFYVDHAIVVFWVSQLLSDFIFWCHVAVKAIFELAVSPTTCRRKRSINCAINCLLWMDGCFKNHCSSPFSCVFLHFLLVAFANVSKHLQTKANISWEDKKQMLL